MSVKTNFWAAYYNSGNFTSVKCDVPFVSMKNFV